MLGHSDLNTTKQYARIVNTLVSNEMNKIQSDYKMDDSYNKDKRINPPRFKAV